MKKHNEINSTLGSKFYMKRLVVLASILFLTSQVFSQQQYYGIRYPESVLHVDALDPFYGRKSLDQVRLGELIYSRLWRWNEKLILEPDLVEQMPEVGQGGLVATLRADAKWPDGESVTVDDIIFTLEAYRENGDRGQQFLANMIKCEKINDRKFVLKPNGNLDVPFEYSARIWVPRIQILPKHILNGMASISIHDSYVKQPIGSGPFQIKDIQVAGARREVQLERNQYYKGETKMIREVQVISEPNFNNQYQSIMTSNENSIDAIDLLVEELSTEQVIQSLKSQPHIRMEPYARNAWTGIALNTRKPYLNSVTFRRLLDMMIDDKRLISDHYGNNAKDITGPLLPEFGFYKAGLEDRFAEEVQILDALKAAGYQYDKDERKLYHLNQRTGERTPIKFRVIYNNLFVTSGTREDKALKQIINTFENYGIEIILDPLGETVFNEKIDDYRYWDMAFVRHTFGWDSNVSPIFTQGGNFNYTGYSDSRLTKALQGMNSVNPVLRRKAGEQVQQLCYDNVPYLFLWHVNPNMVYRNIIQNISITPLTYFTTIGGWEVEPRTR